MTKPTFRRIFAYIFDYMIVLLIATAISNISFLNPHMDEYEEVYKEYNDYLIEISGDPNAISNMFNDSKLQDISYNMSYYGISVSIITLVVAFLYYVLFQYYTNGKTAGKLIMGIEVISPKDNKLKFYQILVRSLIINSLFTSFLLLMSILFIKKGAFTKVSMYIQLFDMALVFVSCGMIIYKENGVGLHDLLAGTMVIRSSEKEDILEDLKKAKKVASKEVKKKED